MGGHLTHGGARGGRRQVVQRRAVRRAPRDRPDRPGRGPRPGAARAAEDHLLRRHRDAAHHRLPRPSPRSPPRSDAVLVADIAHIAGLIAGGAHPSPVGHAPVITTTTHKTLRGPRGAMIMTDAEHATAIDKAVFPGLQGGPHNHTTAGIAVALREAAQPSFRGYAAQVVANAKALADGAARPRLRPGVRRDRQPPAARRPHRRRGSRGKPAAKALDRAGIELNFNAVPYDQRTPVRPVRHPPRHPGAHHPRADRGAHAAAGGLDGRGDHGGRQGRRGDPRPHRGRDPSLLSAYPIPGWSAGGRAAA